MGSTIGKNITLTIFGESHGHYVGATICGLPSGIKIDTSFINQQLKLRSVKNKYTTTRNEEDTYEFISGVKDLHTNGNPLTVIMKNNDYHDEEYQDVMRPSHGDYANYLRHGIYGERIGGGFYSARLTAPIVVLGAILIMILRKHHIVIESSITTDFEKVDMSDDALGSEVKTVIKGLEGGIGEPYFDSLESVLAHALFSIPGIKAISFGLGSDYNGKLASVVNDQFDVSDDKITFSSNNCGGINGGYSNGSDIIIFSTFKPASSIAKSQKALDVKDNKIVNYQNFGRHDKVLGIRGAVVIDSLVALVLLDFIIEKKGKDLIK